MNDRKLRAWSEGHGSSDDMVHGINSTARDGAVDATPVKRGIVILCDCGRCGRQAKHIISWAEVAMFYLQQMTQEMKGKNFTRYTREGVLQLLPCNGTSCKPFRLLVDWDDVDQWVEKGIRSGCLDPKIKQAVRR